MRSDDSDRGSVNPADPWAIGAGPESLSNAALAPRLQSRRLPVIRPILAQGGVPRAGLDPALLELLFQPHGHCFALLDSAQLPGLPDQIAARQQPAASLFDGEAAQTFRDASPWLVRLEPDDRLVTQLFTKGPLPSHLWGRHGGSFIRSDLPMDRLRAHFRKYTRVQAKKDGQWRFFRFWESHAIAATARHLDATGRQDIGFLCPADGEMDVIALPDGRTPELWQVTDRAPGSNAPPRTAMDQGLQSALSRGWQLHQYARIATVIEDRDLHGGLSWPQLSAKVTQMCDDLVSECRITLIKNLLIASLCLFGLKQRLDEHRTILAGAGDEDSRMARFLAVVRVREDEMMSGTGASA